MHRLYGACPAHFDSRIITLLRLGLHLGVIIPGCNEMQSLNYGMLDHGLMSYNDNKLPSRNIFPLHSLTRDEGWVEKVDFHDDWLNYCL